MKIIIVFSLCFLISCAKEQASKNSTPSSQRLVGSCADEQIETAVIANYVDIAVLSHKLSQECSMSMEEIASSVRQLGRLAL